MTGYDDLLDGLGVLVTRPRHQAEPLCELIGRAGGRAFAFPVLEIIGPADTAELDACVTDLDRFDWAIFISANAVERALRYIMARRSWPHRLRIAVIGQRSAEELRSFGFKADLCPASEFNSEALLALPEMQSVKGCRVVIFRGDGGRELLRDTLQARGAAVDYVTSYRRARPRADTKEVLRRWRGGEIDVVQVNSIESLENLVAMIGDDGRSLLLDTPLIVASSRMVPAARDLGFRRAPIVASSATDAAVMEALVAWKRQQS